jgi:hypothetical protein
MRFQLVADYEGYIYDSEWGDYITPAGRLVEYPGAPFHGTLSVQEHKVITDQFKETEVPFTEFSADLDELTPVENSTTENSDGTVTHKKVYVVGDITINVIDIT